MSDLTLAECTGRLKVIQDQIASLLHEAYNAPLARAARIRAFKAAQETELRTLIAGNAHRFP
eukprot:3615669-Pleurochrysis_carterae.AAC.1